MPLSEIRERDTLEDPTSGRWITVTHTPTTPRAGLIASLRLRREEIDSRYVIGLVNRVRE